MTTLRVPPGFHLLPAIRRCIYARKPRWGNAHDLLSAIDGKGFGTVLEFPYDRMFKSANQVEDLL